MKQFFLLITSWLFLGTIAMAQKVSLESAAEKAQAFLSKKGHSLQSAEPIIPFAGHAVTRRQQSSVAPFYVFNADDGQGFVIVSGDERTEDILGYAEKGSYDEDQIPENVRNWLKGYADFIASIDDQEPTSARSSHHQVELHDAIAPLLTTRWNQNEPYNNSCPVMGGAHCPTGCVATAMAQIMHYNQWPTGQCTAIPAYSHSTLGTIQGLPATTFDWNNMTDTYGESSTSTEREAVAKLMRYCGQSVKMNYQTASSSAISPDVVAALRNYFNYDVNTRYLDRAGYTARTWDELLYSELTSQRPVFYSGISTGGGHAFVCDGYDGEGFYHINWGWGGYYDGYYKISVLNPNGGGIGSSATEDGYTMDQGAVVGIQRPTSFTDDMRILSVDDLWVSGTKILCDFYNHTGLDGTFDYGFAMQQPGAGNQYQLYSLSNDFVTSQIRSVSLDVSSLGLSAGTYHFFPYSKLTDSNWYRIYGEDAMYIECVVSNGHYTFNYHPKSNLVLESFGNQGNGIKGLPQEVVVELSNSGDEFNDKLYLFASQTDDKGEYTSATGMVIETGTTESGSLFFTPDATGTWHLWLSLNEDGSGAIGPYNVEIANMPTSASHLQVENYEITPNQTTTITATIKNTGTDGYYQPLYCFLFNSTGGMNIDFDQTGYMNLPAGESVTVAFKFNNLTVGKKYFAALRYFTNQVEETMDWLGGNMPFTVYDADEEPIILTADNKQREYGESNPELTYTVSGEGELVGTPTLRCNATKKSPVGDYVISIQKGSVTNNLLTLVNGVLTVTKAPLQISVGSYEKKQGEPLPEFKLSYQGFKNGENSTVLATQPVVTCEATPDSEPGEYPIIVSGAEAGNYDISYVAGVLVVKEADPIIITANNLEREYGEPNPVLTYTSEGAPLVGTPSISCEANEQSPVGTYPIVITKGSVKNYNDTYVNGVLTIHKAPLQISVGSYEKKQGEPMPEFKLSYWGFKNGENSTVLSTQPVVTCEATPDSEPGEYPIIVGGAEAGNYDISYVAGVLVVKAADPVIITAINLEREYGEHNPVLTYTSEGAPLVGTPSISCEANEQSPVGTYPIVITKGSVENYNVTYVNGVLTIHKAPLTVRVGNYHRQQGEENPPFELVYEGWKLNETAAVLKTLPVATTEATPESPIGHYPIIIGGGEAQNYEFIYVNGVLTVLPVNGVLDIIAGGKPFDVYTPSGIKVRSKVTSLKNLPKGIYIINGKKVKK
ncbi:MAG: C10 family peptidase [Prevotella sp.]|nr:C10 family peptidase [Prevotella sp.]